MAINEELAAALRNAGLPEKAVVELADAEVFAPGDEDQGGVTVHADLTGLDQDDHPQYTTAAELAAAVSAAVNDLLNGAPGALNTLKELADAINDDASYAATITTALAGKQPLDSDLSAIAALTTTAFGRSFLDRADAAAGRTLLGLGSAATTASSAYDASGAAAAAQAASQPLDSDLTAIALLSTTAFGRSLLAAADASALQTLAGVSAFIKTFLDDADAATARATLGVTSVDTTAPPATSSLKVWLKGDSVHSGLADGDPVSTWDDASGNSHPYTGSGATRPTYKTNIQNGLSVVRFVAGGSPSQLLGGDLSAVFPSAAHILVACKADAGWNGLIDTASAGKDAHWYFGGTGYVSTLRTGRVAGYPGQAFVPPTGRHLFEVFSDSTVWGLGYDGTRWDYTSSYEWSTQSHLGNSSDDGRAFIGDIYEVLIYNRLLTGVERSAAFAYLATKWAAPF